MFNIFKMVASEAPTFSPVLKIGTSLIISIVSLEIFVGMDKAWKKYVFLDQDQWFGLG
jgi:hypothetical protein